jgi:hypothetical protein
VNSVIVGVDTGVKYHARALVIDGRLLRSEHVQSCEPIARPWEAAGAPRGEWRLVIECAHARPEDGRIKLREVDALNRAAGRLGALHPAPEFVTASQWKGSTSKKLDHARTLALLTDAERRLLPTKQSELVHVLDAVGIALWACGRKHPERGAAVFEGGPGPSFRKGWGDAT